MAADDGEAVRVWMVERTYSADSPNIIVVTYATPDGERSLQKEWAYNHYGNTGAPEVTAARDVDPDRLVAVDDPEIVERYRAEAARMRERHDPGDAV